MSGLGPILFATLTADEYAAIRLATSKSPRTHGDSRASPDDEATQEQEPGEGERAFVHRARLTVGRPDREWRDDLGKRFY